VGITSAQGRSTQAALLTELDSLGNTHFFKIFRYPENFLGHFICRNDDSTYLIGGSIIPNLVLIKLHKDFTFDWSITYPSSCVTVRNIITTSDNGYYVVTDLGVGPLQVIRLNSDGDVLWYKSIS